MNELHDLEVTCDKKTEKDGTTKHNVAVGRINIWFLQKKLCVKESNLVNNVAH